MARPRRKDKSSYHTIPLNTRVTPSESEKIEALQRRLRVVSKAQFIRDLMWRGYDSLSKEIYAAAAE